MKHTKLMSEITQNGTRDGLGNSALFVKIGGTASFASTTDGTGAIAIPFSEILPTR